MTTIDHGDPAKPSISDDAATNPCQDYLDSAGNPDVVLMIEDAIRLVGCVYEVVGKKEGIGWRFLAHDVLFAQTALHRIEQGHIVAQATDSKHQ